MSRWSGHRSLISEETCVDVQYGRYIRSRTLNLRRWPVLAYYAPPLDQGRVRALTNRACSFLPSGFLSGSGLGVAKIVASLTGIIKIPVAGVFHLPRVNAGLFCWPARGPSDRLMVFELLLTQLVEPLTFKFILPTLKRSTPLSSALT